MNFADRVVVITGITGGLGRVAARRLPIDQAEIRPVVRT